MMADSTKHSEITDPEATKPLTEVSGLIGVVVYIEVRPSGYQYSTDREWKEGVIVGEFINGNVLVEYGDGDLERCGGEEVAFKNGVAVNDLESSNPEATTDNLKSAKEK